MAGYTLAQAQAQLDAWLAASLAVATSQEYSIGGRSLKRADAAVINANIAKWQKEVLRLERGGGIRITGATPI